MTAVRCSILCVLTILTAIPVLSQKTREITKQERELGKLRNEIAAFENRLRESEKREQSTLEHLDDLEQQSALIRQLIRKLREEEKAITRDIDDAKESIDGLEKQLQALRTHYAGYVRSVYKNGRVYDVELLFSSNSINQLLIRIEYLKRFSGQRVNDLKRILQKKSELEQENDQLQQTLKNERSLLVEKTKEEESLKVKAAQRQRVLNRIRTDKKSYRQELSRKTAAVKRIEQLIADLIEKERMKREELRKRREAAAARERERLAAANKAPVPVVEVEPTGAFAQMRGRLRWPVASGAIASKFGNQTHPVLKTVTQNSGVDISVKVGTNVVAVAEGEVSLISFIPGYGNVVILNHYNGYRTVYAHLSDIHVAEAQKVREGDPIGKSGDSLAGSILHFEVWQEREKMDPESWLA
ncbi:MAG: peptidoglycan DD-metalloendopeptidase family protein, partial [Bacteroidota bacterium]